MEKFHDFRLMLKNSWGGGETVGLSPPPRSENSDYKELGAAWMAISELNFLNISKSSNFLHAVLDYVRGAVSEKFERE